MVSIKGVAMKCKRREYAKLNNTAECDKSEKINKKNTSVSLVLTGQSIGHRRHVLVVAAGGSVDV